MKTAIVTDSTAYLSSEEYAQTGIKRVPLSVIMEGKAFREEVDLTAEEFYKKLDEAEQIPTSSQPTVGDFLLFTRSSRMQGMKRSSVFIFLPNSAEPFKMLPVLRHHLNQPGFTRMIPNEQAVLKRSWPWKQQKWHKKGRILKKFLTVWMN